MQAYEQRDYAAAVKWFRKAAEQGNASAQGMLGIMHAEGQGAYYRSGSSTGSSFELPPPFSVVYVAA